MKQNKYPVMFLTQGITAKFADYHDPRTHNIPTGVHFVVSIGILVGIESLIMDLLYVLLPWCNLVVCFL